MLHDVRFSFSEIREDYSEMEPYRGVRGEFCATQFLNLVFVKTLTGDENFLIFAEKTAV